MINDPNLNAGDEAAEEAIEEILGDDGEPDGDGGDDGDGVDNTDGGDL